MANKVPVYVFSGFLDSGKTTSIKETLYNPNFNEGEKSLIIAFEQGDVIYDDKFLKIVNAEAVYLDSLKEFTKEKMMELNKEYYPERVILELNGMDDDRELFKQGFCSKWELAQTLTLIDASTFRNYVTNMRQFIFNHVYNAEVVIINRSTKDDRKFLRNNIKAINPSTEIIYEDENGNATNAIDEEFFDLSKDLDIADEDYGLWYMDAVDHAKKYDNKVISFNLKYLEPVTEYSNVGIFGRPAMVCCAQDITNISITCVDVDVKNIKVNSFYHLKGRLHTLVAEDGRDTCVLYATECTEIEKPKDEMVYFN